MGGRGSGEWTRWGAKPLVERRQRLEIGEFKRRGLIETASPAPLPLAWTPCYFGGKRPWFRCRCGRRVAILYLVGAVWVCRHCGKLTYAGRNENKFQQAVRRALKIKNRLGVKRPKGMHRATYNRLGRNLEAAFKTCLGALAARWGRK